MRNRSNARRSMFSDSSSTSDPLGAFEQSAWSSRLRSRRRRASSSPYHEDSDESPISPAPPPVPRMPSSRLLSPDAVLRNTAVAGIFLALGFLFLKVVLYIAVIMTGVIIPAWRTFKSLERPRAPLQDAVEFIEIDGDMVEVEHPSDDAGIDITSDPAMGNPASAGMSQSACNDQLRVWHKYWILIAILCALDSMLLRPFVFAILPTPIYHAALVWLFVWLNTSRAANAAAIYDTFVRPVLVRSEHAVDVGVTSVLGHVDYISRHIILGANRVVEPYARQLEHAAAVTRRQMEERAREAHVPDNYFN